MHGERSSASRLWTDRRRRHCVVPVGAPRRALHLPLRHALGGPEASRGGQHRPDLCHGSDGDFEGNRYGLAGLLRRALVPRRGGTPLHARCLCLSSPEGSEHDADGAELVHSTRRHHRGGRDLPGRARATSLRARIVGDRHDFLCNPVAAHALPSHFPDGSAQRSEAHYRHHGGTRQPLPGGVPHGRFGT